MITIVIVELFTPNWQLPIAVGIEMEIKEVRLPRSFAMAGRRFVEFGLLVLLLMRMLP